MCLEIDYKEVNGTVRFFHNIASIIQDFVYGNIGQHKFSQNTY